MEQYMKFLTELMRVKRLDDDDAEEKKPALDQEASGEDDGQDFQGDDEADALDGQGGDEQDGQGDDFSEFDDLAGDQGGEEGDDDLDFGDGDEEDMTEEGDPDVDNGDPDRAGVIRTVKGAHLVYKREQEDGTYEEMWIYNSGEFKRDMDVKKAIVAGTDIPANATQSPDGAQQVRMWSAGNADIIVLTGLPQ